MLCKIYTSVDFNTLHEDSEVLLSNSGFSYNNIAFDVNIFHLISS